MKIKPITARLCLWSSAVLTFVGVILRTVAMFTCFDTEAGYFNDSLHTTLVTILSFAAALLPMILSIATPKGTLPTVWPEPKRDLAPVLPFALFTSSGVWILWQYVSDSQDNILLLLAGGLSLVAALYDLLLISRSAGKGINVNALAAIGYAPIFWSLLSVAETYTDQFTTMNSPIKLGLQFGFLSVALTMVAELRFRLGKSTPRAALCFHAIALYLCLTGSIPTLIALAAGILNRPIHGAYALALLGAGVYAAFRLVYYFTIPSPEITQLEATDTETHETDSDPHHIIGE